MSNPAKSHDSQTIFSDFTSPAKATEKVTLTADSVSTLSTLLQRGRGYVLVSIGDKAWFTLDGTTPTYADGTDGGMPLLDGQERPVMIPSSFSSGTVKLVSAGTPEVVLYRVGESRDGSL